MNSFERQVFVNGNANWIDLNESKIQKHNSKVHSSIKMTPIQVSKPVNEKKILNNLKDKSEKLKPKIKLVRIADIDKTFSKGDATNWGNKLSLIAEIIEDNIPTYLIDCLPERYIQSILKKLKLSNSENNQDKVKMKLEN